MSNSPINNENVYFVILAGGSGERLWPLSRQTLPKQLLTIGHGKTLIEQAIDRISPLAQSDKNIWISTTKDYEDAITAHVGDRVGNIVVEPVSRNTGASILYCCYLLQQYNPNARVIFLPADAFIPTQENETFRIHVQQHIQSIQHSNIITLSGVKPTHSSSRYGYIEFDAHESKNSELYKITNFHEKPTQAVAQYYLQLNNMLWNIGMFAAQVSVFIDTFKKTAPTLFACIDGYSKGNGAYEDAPNISIDYAVIEQATNVWVIPAQFTWCDVGNIDIFLTLQEHYGKKINKLIEVDATNNLIQASDTCVAIVGISNICVVQTDNIILITTRDKTDLVKNIVHQLKNEKIQEYL